jgi:hypothetical protein
VALRLIVIDLTNGWLTDDEMKTSRAGAGEMLESLSAQYRLAAFVETTGTGLALRGRLEDLGLGGFFETVATSGDVGAVLSPAAVRKIATTVGTPATEIGVISSLSEVVDTLQMAGVVALLAEPGTPLTDLPEALAWLTAISSN